MAVTRSRSVERAAVRRVSMGGGGWRMQELLATAVAALLVAGGLLLVYRAKSAGLAEIDAGLAARRLLNLNDLRAREDLLPALAPLFARQRDREQAAQQIYYLSGSLPN